MKNTRYTLLIGFFVLLSNLYAQNTKTSSENQDTFTYKKINVIDTETTNIPLSGGNVESKMKDVEGAQLASAGSSSPIGETLGNLSVSLTGAAVYDIPIAVPPGINGVQPTISLSYNSQNGNGLAGYGWNISGISTITRIPATKYHDDEIDGVDFDNLERFALDGERLVLKSGTYGANGAIYETETFSNIKIVSYGTSPYGTSYGPSYFLVYYPDGSKAWYGNSTNSRSQTNYSITYWENPQGVRISYEYRTDHNSQSISKIKYGGLRSNAPINEIRFNYTNNPRRWEQVFVNSKSFVRSKLLKSIEVYGKGTRYRLYSLYYGSYTKLKYERLQSVVETSGDGSQRRHPIKFHYETTQSSINVNELETDLGLANIEQRNSRALSLDLTGNGKMDFIVYPRSAKNKFWVFKDIQSSSTYNYPFAVNSGTFESIFATTLLNHQNKVLLGQGLTVVQKGPGNKINFKVYSNAISQPIGLQYTKSWYAPTYTYENSPTSTTRKNIPQEYISGDFNGDGLTDVLAIGKPYSSRYCYKYDCPDSVGGSDCIEMKQKVLPKKDPFSKHQLIDKKSAKGGSEIIESYGPPRGDDCIDDGGSDDCYSCNTYTNNYKSVHFINLRRDHTSVYSQSAGSLQLHVSDSDQLRAGDFNGDGKTDLLHVTNGKLLIYTLNKHNYLTLLWQFSDSGIKAGEPLFLGDYNGDGKTDFLDPVANNSKQFRTFISTGTTFIKETTTQQFTYIKNNTYSNGEFRGYNLIPIDINGDGRTDIVRYSTKTYNNSSNGYHSIKVYSNYGITGSTSATKIRFQDAGSISKTGNLKHYPIPIFLSSSLPNKNLEFAAISNKWVTSFSFTNDHREDVLLRSVTNNGVKFNITYSNIDPDARNSSNMRVYELGNEGSYPNIDIRTAPGTKVVSMLERVSMGTPTLRQLYTYKGAVYNAEGLGFLSFKGIARSNWHTNGSDRIFNVSLYDLSLRGALTANYSQAYNYSFTVPTSNYISKTTYQNASSLSANKVFKLWVTSSSSHNKLDGSYANTTYQYNTYNSITNVSTNYLGGSSFKTISYDNSTGSNYYIGRPKKIIATSTVGGNSFTTEEQYTYNSSNLLTQKKTKGNNTPYNYESYTYDTFGNLITKSVKPNGAGQRILKFQYDSSGRFLVKSTDVENFSTYYKYNPATGALTRETNHFGQQTKFEYDAWNQQTKVIDYLGKEATVSFTEANSIYTVTTNADDGSGSITIYDPLGRVSTVMEKNVLGQWVSISYLYDKFDRIWKQSEPYTGSNPTQWNEITYDFYGRPIKQQLYTGRNINISYNGLSVTVNDGVKTVTTSTDGLGNTLSVNDPGGIINYTYYGNGNLKSANYNGVVVTTEQDGWGRKTKLIDPSAGTYTYAYNGFGELTKETTPKGTTNYTYSSVGKLTGEQITDAEGSVNMAIQYAYNNTYKALSSITTTTSDGNNSTYNYGYDGQARLTSVFETNPYAEFKQYYTYDSFGRIETEQYNAKLLANNKTSSKKIRNVYQNGGLKTIKDYSTNNNIWNLNGINARGQLTSATVGNGITKTSTYDTYGYLTKNTVKNTSQNIVMELTTSFNVQRGTLNSRSNSMFSWSETFGYDNLDRLINFNDNHGNNTLTYDNKGRITTNSVIGDYTYTGNSYRVANIDLNDQGDLHYQQHDLQQVKYNAFKQPVEINQDGKEKIGFRYNAFRGRAHMFYGDTEQDIEDRSKRKHYSYDISMEISYDDEANKTVFVTYIGGDAYSAPAIWRSEQNGPTSEEYFYLHRDYLGSILLITDGNGVAKEKRHFDAWGNIVQLTDGNGNMLDKLTFLDRGYTGHEHLQGVGLIHMNGRLYDPKLKRFLSPDNYIQDIGNTQNFNRYGYVLNNPLMYTDPSGEFGIEALGGPWGIAAGAIIGSVVSSVNWGSVGRWLDDNIWQPIKKLQPGKWINGWFKKREKKAAPVEYHNYANLTSDPLAGSSTNLSTSLFGGGGTDSGGLGIRNSPSTHMLSQASDNNSNGPWNYRWANSDSLVGSISYNLVNDLFQVVQTFDLDLIPSGGVNPLTGKRSNINIDGTPNYHPTNGFVNTFTSLIPIARGTNFLKGVIPKGLGYLNKINASQFSRMFRGNLARFKPAIRGKLNRIINKGIDTYNNQFSNGLITFKTLMLKKLIRKEE